MADGIDIDAVVMDAAASILPKGQPRRVLTEPFLNSLGEPALRVTIVLGNGKPDKVDGDSALDILLKVSDSLWLAGETRLPMFVFATEEELSQSGDADD